MGTLYAIISPYLVPALLAPSAHTARCESSVRHTPMSCLNIILTALMGIGAWAGSRRIIGGHQVT